jgi:hypothetical protein
MISNQSGGGSFETCTIAMQNRVFIPIPPQIQGSFLPSQNEEKRFEVRWDILLKISKYALINEVALAALRLRRSFTCRELGLGGFLWSSNATSMSHGTRAWIPERVMG